MELFRCAQLYKQDCGKEGGGEGKKIQEKQAFCSILIDLKAEQTCEDDEDLFMAMSMGEF